MSPAFCGYRSFSCAWCGKSNTISAKRELRKKRFCNTSCSAKWRMSQPEIKAKVHNEAVTGRILAAKKGKKYPKISKWWTEHNPMKNPESRAKARATLIEMGHDFKERGGNGRGPTKPQAALHNQLKSHGFDLEVIEKTKPARLVMPDVKMPSHYKIDIGHRFARIAIEVDGPTHDNPKRFDSDARKDKVLTFLGWKVVRVKNERALTEPEVVAKEVLALLRPNEE